MYYEAREHKRRTMPSADAVAYLLHHHKDESGDLHCYDAVCWLTPDGRELAIVADGHIDNIWFEAAVIDLTNSVQIESLTIGWMEGYDKKLEYIKGCETTEFRMGKTTLPLDGSNLNTPADFECGCCGEGFRSTLAVQKKFDQDSGYGICNSCAKEFY